MAKKFGDSPSPTFFESPAAFRAWLRANHSKAPEILVGFHKVHKAKEGAKTMTWPESVAEALCYGWIDGVRKSLGADQYTIRFTPRRKGSKWSAVNVRLIAELEAAGRMMDAGRAAFEARTHKTGPKAMGYSYEKREATLDDACLRAFKKERGAWEFFEAQPPGYKKLTAWWVMQAKKAETRERRLKKLMAESGKRKRLM